jgi:N-sulfoglucosamine sulfohydrolase
MNNKLGIMALAALVGTAAQAAKHTNILFIHMEDMGPHFAAYGNRTAHTPQLDRLAAEGVVFHQACVTAATCASSRGSLLSGLYPHQNGIMGFIQTHGFYYREGLPTLVPMLKDAGYYTGITYKTGVEPWEMTAFDQNHNWRVNKLFPEDNQNEIKNGIDNFKHFLETRPKDRPFYFQSQNSDTHTPWVGEKVDKHFFIKGMPGAEIYKPIDPATVGPLPHFGPDFDMNDKVRSFLAGYYEATQRVDYFVGRILALLKEYGVEEETLVIFSADHGPSHLSRGKTTAYEFGLRVPFIVRWPGKTAVGKHSDALVSFVDLMPTFLEVAGIERPKHLPGHSLVPVFDGRKPEGVRKYIYSAYVSHTTAYYLYWPTRTISDGRYKLICNVNGNGSTRRDAWMGTDADPGLIQDNADQRIRDAYKTSGPIAQQAYDRSLTPPEFELYDLKNDPGEILNLAGQDNVAQIESRLKADLLKWRVDTVADPFLDPAYVRAFNKDYAAKVAFYNDHKKDKKVVEGMSNLNRWGKWRLDMSRWIPDWDPAGYGQDPAR